ncbi:MAG: BufA1 family periplasmic bufferin-type metallophore [Burkholderiales bacterium]
MNQRAVIAAAAATLFSTMLIATPAAAQEKEKCYGIAKAGQNDCANLAGTHSCAGQSTVSDDKGEWKYVAKGTCAGLKGLTADQAKAAVKKG